MPILLRHQLHNAARLHNLPFCLLAEVTSTHDHWYVRKTSFSENFCVTEGEEVEDGGSVGVFVGEVVVALLGRDERPELWSGHVSARFGLRVVLSRIKMMEGDVMSWGWCRCFHQRLTMRVSSSFSRDQSPFHLLS